VQAYPASDSSSRHLRCWRYAAYRIAYMFYILRYETCDFHAHVHALRPGAGGSGALHARAACALSCMPLRGAVPWPPRVASRSRPLRKLTQHYLCTETIRIIEILYVHCAFTSVLTATLHHLRTPETLSMRTLHFLARVYFCAFSISVWTSICFSENSGSGENLAC
jgi:hypothetical protein